MNLTFRAADKRQLLLVVVVDGARCGCARRHRVAEADMTGFEFNF